MNEIICPNCSKAFKVDETGYANILQQVLGHAFKAIIWCLIKFRFSGFDMQLIKWISLIAWYGKLNGDSPHSFYRLLKRLSLNN